MGRPPCCDEHGLKKGPWTAEEDTKLREYIEQHGHHGSWRRLPKLAGLNRCGKSCRLRWTNYLRPDIKRGEFTPAEEKLIIQLHSVLGNKWSAIAGRLPGRTDNEIKNYWNTHLRKKLLQMGIDPVTHQPRAGLNLLAAALPRLLAAAGGAQPIQGGGGGGGGGGGASFFLEQLIKVQLAQNLIQLLTCRSPAATPNLALLLQSAALTNHQLVNDSILPSSHAMNGSISTPTQLDLQQLIASYNQNNNAAAAIEPAAADPDLSSDCATNSTTPPLVPSSPENVTAHTDGSTSTAVTASLDALDDLTNYLDLDDDLVWKDFIEESSSWLK